MTDAPKKLSAREAEFCRQWMVDRKVAPAMRRAGYSEQTARHKCAEMMRRPLIIAELLRLQAEHDEKFHATIDRVKAELGRLAFANMADYTRLIGEDRVIDLSECDRDQLAAIAEITIEDFKEGRGEDARDVRRVKIKLHDKKGALRDYGQHLGMFPSKMEVTGKDGEQLQSTVIILPNNGRN